MIVIDQTPRLTVVVPTYNEAATVLQSLDRVLAQPFVNEVVVVNDASTDQTGELLASLHDSRVRVITHSKNRGKGAALRSGFAVAGGPYVGIHDADLEYDPADFAKLLVPLDEGKADVVFGSRFISGEARRVLFYWHSVGNRLLTWLSNMATNTNMSDMETCYKVFRREILDQIVIEEDRFGFEPEITAKVAGLGARIYEVGISYSGRTYAEGKKISWRDGLKTPYQIIKYSNQAKRDAKVARDIRDLKEVDREQFETLESLESVGNYNGWVADLISSASGKRILDVGAGTGSVALELHRRGHEIHALEPAPLAFDRLNERAAELDGFEVTQGFTASLAPNDRYNAITLTNVLEHIEAPVAFLRDLSQHLEPDGRIVVFVPASMGLYANFDRLVGHWIRFSPKRLARTLEAAGLEVVSMRNVNFLGFFAWWLYARVLAQVPTRPKASLLYDKAFVPLTRLLEGDRGLGVGQSIFAVAQKS